MKDGLKQRDVIIGYRIKSLREKEGYSQNKVAEFLKISPQHYGTLERGVNSCTWTQIMKICDFYDVSIVTILGNLDNSERQRTQEHEKIASDICTLTADHKETILVLVNYFKEKEQEILKKGKAKKSKK